MAWYSAYLAAALRRQVGMIVCGLVFMGQPAPPPLRAPPVSGVETQVNSLGLVADFADYRRAGFIGTLVVPGIFNRNFYPTLMAMFD